MELSQSRIASRRLLYSASSGNPDSARPETALAVGLVAYSGTLAWGLLNYLLGLIVALLAFAAWHSWRERPWLRRLALFTCAATALYLIHFLGFVLYGVLVVSYELLGRRQPWRTPPLDWTVLAGQAIPALALWATLRGNAPTGEHAAHYWLLAKLLTFESPFLFGGSAGGPDVGLVIFAFAAIAVLLAVHRGWLEWPRAVKGPVLALMALAIVLPFRVIGVSLIDYRFPLAATCLALAGIGLTRRSQPFAAPVAVAILALTAVRVSDVSFLMHRCDREYEEVRDALAGLPRGSELLTVVERTERVPGVACTSLPIYEHVAQLIAIDRSGYAPDFFAHVQSVAVRGDRASDTDPIAADAFTTAPASGYVLWIHLGHRRPPPPGLVPIHRGSYFDIWQPQFTPAASAPPPDPPAPSARASSPSG
jgi:hypothetical protein